LFFLTLEITTMIRTVALASLIITLAISTVSAQGVSDQNPGRFQGGQSGVPLSFFCNHVPDLSVQRSDGVDNWVRICSVWFASQRHIKPIPLNSPTAAPNSK
jgi:hypothetical protein